MTDSPYPMLSTHIAAYFGLENRSHVSRIVDMFQPEHLDRGTYFVEAGRRCDRLSFIRSGLTRTYVEHDNREVTQWIGYPETFITDLGSLVFEQAARWHIQAITDVEVLSLYRSDYVRLGAMIPEWHLLEKLFIAKCFTVLEERVFMHLSLTAEERYQMLFEQHRDLFQQVPLQYLASMLGMTPETFSRIRRKRIS